MASKRQILDSLYHYRGRVVSVYDGDTCTVDIDLGMGVWVRGEKVRLYGINAPELRGAEEEKIKGRAARDFLRDQIDGKDVLLQSVKDRRGKYGRYLATIWVEDEQGKWVNVNELLVREGHAMEKEY